MTEIETLSLINPIIEWPNDHNLDISAKAWNDLRSRLGQTSAPNACSASVSDAQRLDEWAASASHSTCVAVLDMVWLRTILADVRRETIEACAGRCDDSAESFRDEREWGPAEGSALCANRLRFGYDAPPSEAAVVSEPLTKCSHEHPISGKHNCGKSIGDMYRYCQKTCGHDGDCE